MSPETAMGVASSGAILSSVVAQAAGCVLLAATGQRATIIEGREKLP